MKGNVSIQVRPFTVPDHVYLVAEQGDATNASVKLSALDESTLSAMCDAWRSAIFKLAGKTDPRLK